MGRVQGVEPPAFSFEDFRAERLHVRFKILHALEDECGPGFVTNVATKSRTGAMSFTGAWIPGDPSNYAVYLKQSSAVADLQVTKFWRCEARVCKRTNSLFFSAEINVGDQ